MQLPHSRLRRASFVLLLTLRCLLTHRPVTTGEKRHQQDQQLATAGDMTPVTAQMGRAGLELVDAMLDVGIPEDTPAGTLAYLNSATPPM